MSSTSPHLCEEEEGTSYWKLPVHYSGVPQENLSHLMRQTTMLGDAFRGKSGKESWTGDATPKETGGIHPTKCVSCQMSRFNYQGPGLL